MGNGIIEGLGIAEPVAEPVSQPVIETPATPAVAPAAPVAPAEPATPAAPAEPAKADTVPLAVFLEQKNARKQAEIEAAEMRGRLAAMQELASQRVQPEQPAQVIDPYAGIEPDALLTPVDLQRIEANKELLRQQQAQQSADAQRVADARESYQTALTQHTDLQSIINAGEQFLTKGDKVDIYEGGKNAIQIAYQRCKLRLTESGKLPAPATVIPNPAPVVPSEQKTEQKPDAVIPAEPMTPSRKIVSFLTE